MNSTAFDLLRSAALLVLTPQCFDKYFIDFNFLDGPCFSATLSKCLGLSIIVGSLLVKLPQILKIHRSRSGEGISVLSVTLDLVAITIYGSYNYVKQFPFSAWGDATFLAIQTVLIGVLVLHYGGNTLKAVLYLAGYVVTTALLTSSLVPMKVLWILQGCNIVFAVSGKLTQAYVNYKNGHTGQLSAITLFMLFFGSTARIFTSIQETGDNMIIIVFVASSCANAVLVVQLLYYWNVGVVKEKST